MKLKRYRGGGVLYWTRNADGKKEILLGLRKYGFDRNTWSIPGGGLQPQDAGDLVRCAVREAQEEGFAGHPIVEAALRAAQSRELMAPGSGSVRIRLPFFDWRTLLVELPEKPDKWPRRIREFREAKWFRVNELPARTHWGVRWVLLASLYQT
jgi:8-oxo-dGTP pyrophosphatase MutT (NUDIX family)